MPVGHTARPDLHLVAYLVERPVAETLHLGEILDPLEPRATLIEFPPEDQPNRATRWPP